MGNNTVTLAHGAGGAKSKEIEGLFRDKLSNIYLEQKADASILPILNAGSIAITTDSFVVKPLFFNGGDIGSLAVSGTVNDLLAAGAEPLYLTLGVIIEEGFLLEDLKRIISSISETAQEAGVMIVAGDTKVVGKGEGSGIFINTTGIGAVVTHHNIFPSGAKPGDCVIVTGGLGEHGMAVLQARAELPFLNFFVSDAAPLSELLKPLLKSYTELHVMRDPTRGGLAAVLNEISLASKVSVIIWEDKIPVSSNVAAASAMLGIDILETASEGRMVIIAPAKESGKIVSLLKQHVLGLNAAVIGEIVSSEEAGSCVTMKTKSGGTRIVAMPLGEIIPRIC